MRHAAFIIAGLLLFLSLGCIGLPGSSSKADFVMKWGWGNLAGTALMTVVLLLAIGYMAASLMNDEKLKAWTKKEIGQALYSVLIFVFAISLVGVLDQLLHALSTGAGELVSSNSWRDYVELNVCCDPSSGTCVGPARHRPCHIELASQFLQFLYETARMNALSSLMNYWFFAFLSNMSVGISLLVFSVQAGLSVTPLAGLSAAADYFSILFDLAVKTMMITRAQQVLLDFLNFPVFSVFMAMGLVLRIFYFTRKLGGLLVALALVFYTVYPMFYVVSYAVLWGFLDSWTPFYSPEPIGAKYDATEFKVPFSDPQPVNFLTTANAKDVYYGDYRVNLDVCNSTLTGSDPQIRQLATDDRIEAESIRQNFKGMWDKIEGTKWYTQFSDIIKVGLGMGFDKDGPVGALATVLVFTLFVPFLALMTSLATVKVVSPLIGGDVEISLLSRLI